MLDGASCNEQLHSASGAYGIQRVTWLATYQVHEHVRRGIPVSYCLASDGNCVLLSDSFAPSRAKVDRLLPLNAGKGVYLDLSVKVQDKWRDSLQSVQQLGY